MRGPEPGQRPELPVPVPESCDGLDNDLDGEVDEDFRDDLGRYVDKEHCGVCDRSCEGAVDHAVRTDCGLVASVPMCVALECEPGYRRTDEGKCVAQEGWLCLPCLDDEGCGGFEGARCADLGGEMRCSLDCAAVPCPSGYLCEDSLCNPPGRSCTCDDGDTFDISCNIVTPEGGSCIGIAHCVDGSLGECAGKDEICDGIDNDCDGQVDEDFRDELGAYSLDNHNCGTCGVDCDESTVPEGSLVCGGDPYHPICHLLCPDTVDGIQVGDHLDADLIIATGCECTLTNQTDLPGPEGAFGEDLDVNCDGADGDVRRSLYVAPDGDDANPGSYMYPVATIGAAVVRAEESLGTETPRPDVYLAAGTYFETITLHDGVSLHGGYRKDFLNLDSMSFLTVVIAPDAAASPGGSALVIDGGGVTPTTVEGIRFIGAQPDSTGLPSFGIFIKSPGPELTLRSISVDSASTMPGPNGSNGRAGNAPSTGAAAGDPPRGAVEDSSHTCIDGTPENTVRGGSGGTNTCGGVTTSGGAGGGASCPVFNYYQPAGGGGSPGGPSTPGGAGGSGGWDCEGPVTTEPCPTWICCGLADFTVPLEYQLAGDGLNGASGIPGSPGAGCVSPLGTLSGETWIPEVAGSGSMGGPAAGGGGGGAGGGASMIWYDFECPYADGLGGGGGGGGAGGCGGQGGTAGASTAPTVAIVIAYEWSGPPPAWAPLISFENVTVMTGSGGRGGRGGAGGDGGEGGLGGEGGDNPLEERTTPTLAGPTKGGHGGKGGSGGPGGGGGGGCGGSSVGVWAILRGAGDPGMEAAASAGCIFQLGDAGAGGSGGGGASPGQSGNNGIEQNVVIQ